MGHEKMMIIVFSPILHLLQLSSSEQDLPYIDFSFFFFQVVDDGSKYLAWSGRFASSQHLVHFEVRMKYVRAEYSMIDNTTSCWTVRPHVLYSVIIVLCHLQETFNVELLIVDAGRNGSRVWQQGQQVAFSRVHLIRVRAERSR
jgi:hypothetical protein